jgi:hypothetical protein
MHLLVALLLLQTDPGGEVPELLRMLGSEVLEERTRAESRLKEIGRPAIPALEGIARSGDSELRARSRGILEFLARKERVGALRPSDRRVSADLQDVPFSDAIRQVLGPYGMKAAAGEGNGNGRRVTLSLKGAHFWEAIARLEEASGTKFHSSTGVFSAPTEWPVQSAGNVHGRVEIDSWGSRSNGRGESKKALFLYAGLSPGAWACNAEVNDLKVVDRSGKPIDHEWVGSPTFGRTADGISRGEVGTVAIGGKDLAGVEELLLTGTMALDVPNDIERRFFSQVKGKIQVPGGTLRVDYLDRREDGLWHYGVDIASDEAPVRALLSVEDENGRWMGDLRALYHSGHGSLGVSSSVVLAEGKPFRSVATIALGTDRLEIPFRLSVKVDGK